MTDAAAKTARRSYQQLRPRTSYVKAAVTSNCNTSPVSFSPAEVADYLDLSSACLGQGCEDAGDREEGEGEGGQEEALSVVLN